MIPAAPIARAERSSAVARGAVAFAAAIAVVVLLGWMIGSPRLRSFLDPRWQTNPVTAFGHLAMALTLWRESRAVRVGARGFAASTRAAGVAATLTGAYQLWALLADTVPRLDLRVFTWGVPADVVSRGAGVSVETALAFVLLGLGLAIPRRERTAPSPSRRARVAEWLVVTPFVFAVAALVRFLYDTHPWSPRLATYVPMAASTALLFLATSAGVLATHPGGQVRAALGGDTRTSHALRGLLPGVFLVLVMAGFASLSGYRAGLYGSGFGFSLLVTAAGLLVSALLWHRARDLARSERELARRATELEELNRELDAFTYSVSHDLRAPLRAVRGFAAILANEQGAALDDEGRRVLGVLRGNAERMDEMIEHLLRFARLTGQAATIESIDMNALVDRVLRDLAGRIEASGAAVTRGELPEVAGDPDLLQHVWTNLLDNALKFSAREASPRVTVEGAVVGPDVIYRVTDNGVGFDMAYSHKLFGVFNRLHSRTEFAGTGVGLAIVRGIVQRHGGRIWAEAGSGRGAAFSFALPTDPHAPPGDGSG